VFSGLFSIILLCFVALNCRKLFPTSPVVRPTFSFRRETEARQHTRFCPALIGTCWPVSHVLLFEAKMQPKSGFNVITGNFVFKRKGSILCRSAEDPISLVDILLKYFCSDFFASARYSC
jgi:hypothetical protein